MSFIYGYISGVVTVVLCGVVLVMYAKIKDSIKIYKENKGK